MPDDPTLGALLREQARADRAVADLARDMKEDRDHAGKTYVRADVYAAERRGDHAWIREVAKDVADLQEEKKIMAAFRKQASLVAAGGLLAIAGSFGVALFTLLTRGA